MKPSRPTPRHQAPRSSTTALAIAGTALAALVAASPVVAAPPAGDVALASAVGVSAPPVPPAPAPAAAPAPAPGVAEAGAPAWLRDKLTAAVDDAFSGVFTCQSMRFESPRTIVLQGVLLEPKRPFGWAELAEVPPGGPPRRFDGRLTIERATLELASSPSPSQPLVVSRLVLDKPVLLGADGAAADPAGADGPRVEAGVDRDRTIAPTRTRLSSDPLRTSFEHINVAIHTLPPTVSTVRLRKFLALDALTIRQGQIVTPGPGGGACGIDIEAEGDASGQWRFGLSLTAPAANGWSQVRTQGTGSPETGTINMTNLKFLSVAPDGKSTEMDIGRVRLRLSVERGPANGDEPIPSVDTSAIDSLPPVYGTKK